VSPHPRPLSRHALPHHRERGVTLRQTGSVACRSRRFVLAFDFPRLLRSLLTGVSGAILPLSRGGGWKWRERGPGGEGLPAAALLLVLAAASSFPAFAQPAAPRLEVTLNPQQVTVGDRVEAVLTLTVPAAALDGDPRFPVWGASWGDAEILEKGEPVDEGTIGGTATWRQRLVLAAFRTGKIALPPVQVAVPLKDRTVQAQPAAALAIDVRSVLPAGEKDPKPKPAAPLRQLPLGAAFWWTLAAMSALCAFLYWALWRRQRRRQAASEPAPPQLPPFDELVAALDAIGAEPSMLRLHTRLSLALRQYLGRALAVAALESTTSEVHRRLLGRGLPAPQVRRTVELLRACDLVKFARQEVGGELGRGRVAAVRVLARDLDRFAPAPAPAVAEELEAAG
jgi:hypothetical protein